MFRNVGHVDIWWSFCVERMSHPQHLVSVKFSRGEEDINKPNKDCQRVQDRDIENRAAFQHVRCVLVEKPDSLILAGLRGFQSRPCARQEPVLSQCNMASPDRPSVGRSVGADRSTPRLIRPSRLTVLLCLH